MATNPIPSRGAKLLAVSGQEDNFFIYGDVDKSNDSQHAKDFDRVVSSGTISTDTTGSVWLKVFGYKCNKKDSVGYVLIDDHGIVWEDQPFVSMPAPEMPISVKVESLSGPKGVISWTPILNTAVEIEFASASQGPFRLIAISRLGGGSYDIMNLVKGVTFYYRLRSTNDYGESRYAPVVSATYVNGINVPAKATVTADVVPDSTSPKTASDNDQSTSVDTRNATLPEEQPIITWIRCNPILTLTFGAGVIVTLMMIIVAGRRS